MELRSKRSEETSQGSDETTHDRRHPGGLSPAECDSNR